MQQTFFSHEYLNRATQIFLRPTPEYDWSYIVPRAVGQNTIRGFHRVNTNCPGAKPVFVSYFIENKAALIADMTAIKSRAELHLLSNNICRKLKSRLDNIKPKQLVPYNKLRKPVDLYIEHLVAMAHDLRHARQRLTPLLFLPLDCLIFAHHALFTDEELSAHNLSRQSTYKDVQSETIYSKLQKLVLDRADELKRSFYPIYFDLLWNDRSKRQGGNLFETNP
jgi:hypothetical protein